MGYKFYLIVSMSKENSFANLFYVMYFNKLNYDNKNLALAELKTCLIKQDQEDTEDSVQIMECVYLMILYITAYELDGDIVLNILETLI